MADSSLSGQCFVQATARVYIARSDITKYELLKVRKEAVLVKSCCCVDTCSLGLVKTVSTFRMPNFLSEI